MLLLFLLLLLPLLPLLLLLLLPTPLPLSHWCPRSDEHEEALLDFLQANPAIYDKTMKEYKLAGKKEALWQVQANLMGLKKDEIKLWFTTQRTLYGKLTKDGVSGEGGKQRTERQNWILAKFQFMGTHITRQAKPRQPASLRVKLVQKASATLT